MDIRRYFSSPNAAKKGAVEKFTSISKKEDTKHKDKTKPNSKKRRLVILDSDSDEEPIPTKKPAKRENGISEGNELSTKKPMEKSGANNSSPKSKLNFRALKKHKPEVKALKPVIPDDFFHSPPKKVVNVKSEPEKDEEIDIVDDDDNFQQTLKQLDKKPPNAEIKPPRPEKHSVATYGNTDVSERHKNLLNGDILVTKNKKDAQKTDSLKAETEKEVKKGKKDTVSESPVKKSSANIERKDKEIIVKKSEKSAKHADETKLESKRTDSESQSEAKTKKQEFLDKEKITKTPFEKDSASKGVSKEETEVRKPTKTEVKKSTIPEVEKPAKPEIITPTKTATTPDNKRNALNYRNYLHREGPQALGSKEVPEGEDDCLQGLTFIITGVLESFERDEMKDIIVKYGGKVMANISKTTQYMVIGRDAGPAKLDKAEKFGTKLLNEDELLQMVRTRPGKKVTPKAKTKKELKPKPLEYKIKVEPVENKEMKTSATEVISIKNTDGDSGLMWVDKHKPTSLKQVIGQQGDRSCAKKLLDWLRNWWKNNSLDKKTTQKKWNPKDDGSVYKAALLSGPPGVGKTTTAQLACKELGFNYIELNASDTRSKKSLQTQISELLQNQTISASLNVNQLVQKHIIIFDEVDGMSGNEDRGGTQELIALIRRSKIPVICICNDRQHPKIRSLSNYCFDLRFLRPRVEQIKGAMMSLLHKEKIKVPPESLQDIIASSNQDIRQVLHHLSFLSSKDLSESKGVKPAAKDVRLSPFDVLKKVFAPEETKTNVNEKASLFFHDYSLAPLFVQENYAAVKPLAARSDIHKHLDLLSQAAESISYGDTIDRCIRSQNNWGLLPTQAIFASVIPGECMRGYLSQMILFPSWLGKNSSRNHMDRVLQQIHMHTRLRVSGNKTELGLDYLSHLRRNLTEPLVEYGAGGLSDVLGVMENYYLLREDLDSIVELTQWSGQKDPMSSIEPKAKAALTRALKKDGHKNPYATVSIKKSKKRSADASFDEDGIEESEEEEDDDSKLDAMVKQKKPQGSKVAKQDSEDSSKGNVRGKGSSRGRGRGKK